MKSSSEVPDSVSKLSEKARPPHTDSSEHKKTRKKRSTKLSDIQCECSGICQCVVCSPEVIEKRKATTGRTSPPTTSQSILCCCVTKLQEKRAAPPQSQPYSCLNQNIVMQTHVQQTPKIHPPNCLCLLCECEVCSPCVTEQPPKTSNTEVFLKSTNLDQRAGPSPGRSHAKVDDIFNPPKEEKEKPKGCRANRNAQIQKPGCESECSKPIGCLAICRSKSVVQRINHSRSCECIDCLCLPKIQEIAQIVEFPIVNDEKQIYQVQTMKCNCTNAQNAKKLERSKIPVATNSRSNPPSSKVISSCDCEPCECSPCADPNISKTKSKKGDLSALCDCDDCKCNVCFNKPSKDKDKPTKIPKNIKCCCTTGCMCEICLVEELQKKLEEVSRQLNEQVSKMSPKPSEPASKMGAQTSQISKKSDLISSKQAFPTSHVVDCDCYECRCPKKHTVTQKRATIPEKVVQITERTSKTPFTTSHPADCDCYECKCSSNAVEPKISRGAAEKSDIADIKSVEEQLSSTRSTSHPSDCDCYECKCIKPTMSDKPSRISEKPTDEGDTLHDEKCGCLKCVCPHRKDKPAAVIDDQVSQHKPDVDQGQISKPDGVASPSKASQLQKTDSKTPPSSAAMSCDCAECKCSPCPDPKKMHLSKGELTAIPPLLIPCDCSACACSPCTDPTKNKPNETLDGKSSQTDKSHSQDCSCDKCLCADTDEQDATLASSNVDQTPDVSPKIDQATEVNATIDQTSGKKELEIEGSDCHCEPCECPGKDILDPKFSETHHSDCDCEICACPGKDKMVPKGKDSIYNQ